MHLLFTVLLRVAASEINVESLCHPPFVSSELHPASSVAIDAILTTVCEEFLRPLQLKFAGMSTAAAVGRLL